MTPRTFVCPRCGFEIVLTLVKGATPEHLCLQPRWEDDRFEELVSTC